MNIRNTYSENSEDSFISFMQENEIGSLPSRDELDNFDPKSVLKNNKVDEKMSKLLSLQLYKRQSSQENKVITGL